MSKEIDRLGKKIKVEYPNLSNDTLEKLQQYRVSHKDALASVFNKLCFYSKKVNSSAIVTYRLKRFQSIISKLGRLNTLNLSGMRDIAGCRCIVNDNRSIYKLLDLISSDKDLEFKSVKDYVKKPKDDGYRSLHIYVSCLGSKVCVEIQIRNQVDHSWATLVEITDLLYKTKLKELGDHEELARFHRYLSKKDSISLNEKESIVRIIEKYNYYERLSDVFTRNNIPVRRQWLETCAKGGNYFLIKTNHHGITSLESFPNFNTAEQVYFDTYKSDQDINMVLTHLPKPNYEDLSMAYSNYILTYHAFLDDFYKIVESSIVDSIRSRKYLKFRRYFIIFAKTICTQAVSLTKELYSLDGASPDKRGKAKKLKGRELEWFNHIKNQLQKRQAASGKLSKELAKIIPTSLLWKVVYVRTVNAINRRYEKKFIKARSDIFQGQSLKRIHVTDNRR